MSPAAEFLWRFVIGGVLGVLTIVTLGHAGVPLWELAQWPLFMWGIPAAWMIFLPWILRAVSPKRGRGILGRLFRTGLATGASVWVLVYVPEIRRAMNPAIADTPELLLWLAVPWFLLFTFLERERQVRPPSARAKAPKPPKPPKVARFRITRQRRRTPTYALAGYLDRLNPQLAVLVSTAIQPPEAPPPKPDPEPEVILLPPPRTTPPEDVDIDPRTIQF